MAGMDTGSLSGWGHVGTALSAVEGDKGEVERREGRVNGKEGGGRRVARAGAERRGAQSDPI